MVSLLNPGRLLLWAFLVMAMVCWACEAQAATRVVVRGRRANVIIGGGGAAAFRAPRANVIIGGGGVQALNGGCLHGGAALVSPQLLLLR